VTFSKSYRPALRDAVFLQAFLALIASLILDGGVLTGLLLVASIAFWIGVVLVVFRRPLSPSRFDLSYLRIGLFVLFAICIATTLCVKG
jgi:hypothetical protein